MGDVRCILCGETNTVHLSVADGDGFKCHAGDGDVTRADVREQMGVWARLLAWADLHPAHQPAEAKAKRAG